MTPVAEHGRPRQELAGAEAIVRRPRCIAQILEGLNHDARRELVLPACRPVVVRVAIRVCGRPHVIPVSARADAAASYEFRGDSRPELAARHKAVVRHDHGRAASIVATPDVVGLWLSLRGGRTDVRRSKSWDKAQPSSRVALVRAGVSVTTGAQKSRPRVYAYSAPAHAQFRSSSAPARRTMRRAPCRRS